MKQQSSEYFALTFSSDSQYPWYDNQLPDGLTTEKEIKENSYRQITQQYTDMNNLAKERADSNNQFQIVGAIINGDLTAFGHDWQYDTYYKDMFTLLAITQYPGLGNHDYANNVDDSYNNNCATRMVNFMYDWIKLNAGVLNYDFGHRSYYKFPELRTDYEGSLSYSFNIGKIHIVQLQNYPSYTNEWNSWNAGSARRDFFYIKPSFYWLKNDLAIARNRGDIIIVCFHDYHNNFIEPYVTEFNQIVKFYDVSAVFVGHIHATCGKVGDIPGSSIPYFRSGAASYQDYLVADIDIPSKTMIVRRRACLTEDQNYNFSGVEWRIDLNDYIPEPPLPVPPNKGFVTFFNEGGFVARFELKYTYGGDEIVKKTGNMSLGNKVSYDIPADATNIFVKGEEKTGLVWEGWRTVFDLRFSSPPNNCFKLFGTTLKPKWNNNCE